MKRKVSSVLLTVVLALLCIVPFGMVTASAQDITVYMNGEQIYFDVAPRAINNRTMVPLRAIFEKYGMTVGWEQSTQTITASNGTDSITMQLGSYTFTKNGTVYSLDSPAVAIDNRTLVPVRAISESLNSTVSWNGSLYRVDIVTAGSSYTPPAEQTYTNPQTKPVTTTYVLNTNSKKFHYASCSSAKRISAKNRSTYTGTRSDLINMGYSPCKNCKP